MADGSIIIDTQLDSGGFTKGLSSLSKKAMQFNQANLYDDLIFRITLECPQPYFLDMNRHGSYIFTQISDPEGSPLPPTPSKSRKILLLS